MAYGGLRESVLVGFLMWGSLKHDLIDAGPSLRFLISPCSGLHLPMLNSFYFLDHI